MTTQEKRQVEWRKLTQEERKQEVEWHARQCAKRQQRLFAKWRRALAQAEQQEGGE